MFALNKLHGEITRNYEVFEKLVQELVLKRKTTNIAEKK